MRIKAAIDGSLTELIEGELRVAARGITAAVKRSSSCLQNELRRQVRKAGLGKGLEKAFRKNIYPKRGRSMGAAGLVFSKATRLHEAYSADRTISTRTGSWLVIPADAAIARGFDRNHKKSRGPVPRKHANIEAAGKLAFVQYAPNKAMLVKIEGKKKVPYFYLVKQVRLRKRLDLDGPVRKWSDKMPGYIIKEMERAERA